jgi:hypothetical protein
MAFSMTGGPHKTLYNRFIGWSRMGVFDWIFAALPAEGGRSGGYALPAFKRTRARLIYR